MKDLHKLLRQYRRQGLVVVQTRGRGHWQVTDRDGQLIATAGHNPGQRNLANFRAEVSRYLRERETRP